MSLLRALGAIASSGGAVPAVAGDFIALQTVTIGSGGGTEIEFTGIPGTYDHLQIRGVLSSNSAGGRATDASYFRFNNDSGTNYAWSSLLANGSSITGPSDKNATALLIENMPGTTVPGNRTCFVIDILDYANTSKYKSIRGHQGEQTLDPSVASLRLTGGVWANTNAITSIKIYGNSGNLAQYSTAALYGISGA